MFKDEGRPERVFCNGYEPQRNHLKHEVWLPDFLLPYDEYSVMRRGNDVDQRIRPDAEMEMDDQKYFVELDTGTVHHPKQRKRWKRYDKVADEFLLVVTSSKKRMKNLISSADGVRSIALFTTLKEAIENPFGEIWHDCSGSPPAAVPKPQTKASC